jgi:site-specific DNA-adenine methylase
MKKYKTSRTILVYMRTPIKDLRFTSKALPILKSIIPPESSVETYLLFSGDLEINLAEANRNVTSHTSELSVYDFWLSLFEDSDLLVKHIEHLHPLPNEKVAQVFQKTYSQQKNPYFRAAMFFLLNRCSELGTISSGDYDQKRFNPLALSYIKRYKKYNFDVKCDRDFITSLKQPIDSDFVFIPAGKFNYTFFQKGLNTGTEVTRFNHKELATTIAEIKVPTIVSYSYHPALLDLYGSFKTKILIDNYGKITKQQENAKEVLIANF